MEETFPNKQRLEDFLEKVDFLKDKTNTKEIIDNFINIYIDFVKQNYQNQYKEINLKLVNFLEAKDDGVKIVWGNCLDAMRGMKSESIHLMVTSPPYYNAREYSQWKNLNEYLDDMRLIIKESYRVLDNHRVFVFNVGDIFDNDNITLQKFLKKKDLHLLMILFGTKAKSKVNGIKMEINPILFINTR